MNVRKGNSIKYVRLRLDKEGRQLYVQSQLGAKPQYLTLPNIFIQFSPLAGVWVKMNFYAKECSLYFNSSNVRVA